MKKQYKSRLDLRNLKSWFKLSGSYAVSIINVRGIRSAWVGNEARTIVPDKVIVEIDIRTVPNTDGNRLAGLVKEHIEQQGYTILDAVQLKEMLNIEKPFLLNILYLCILSNTSRLRTRSLVKRCSRASTWKGGSSNTNLGWKFTTFLLPK